MKRTAALILICAAIVLSGCGPAPVEIDLLSPDEVVPGDYAALKRGHTWKVFRLEADGGWREVDVLIAPGGRNG